MYPCYILFPCFCQLLNTGNFWAKVKREAGIHFLPQKAFFAAKGPFMALGSIAFLLLGLLSSLTSMDGVNTGDDGMIA